MQRLAIQQRAGWPDIVEAQGFLFHSTGGRYWDESACYVFSEAEILLLEKATADLWDLCLEAVQHVLDKNLLARFGIAPAFAAMVRHSWDDDAPSLYGRFDLGYDGREVKLLEFNADTPTSLLEAAVIQWLWLQDHDPAKDQFNSLHEKLVARFQAVRPLLPSPEWHFACVRDSVEDYMTTAYLMDCARQAGLSPVLLYMDQIGYDDRAGAFLGAHQERLSTVFKLYPYEWMLQEEFGRYLPGTAGKTRWVEPAWKMLLSNKMILRILWEMFPHHPHLLRTETAPFAGDYVRKPLLSREGANVQIVRAGRVTAETTGDYGAEGHVYQQYFALPDFGGRVPVLGSWLVGGEPAGLGIRESDGPITDNQSRFVPHYFA